jgi:hypothetical protein
VATSHVVSREKRHGLCADLQLRLLLCVTAELERWDSPNLAAPLIGNWILQRLEAILSRKRGKGGQQEGEQLTVWAQTRRDWCAAEIRWFRRHLLPWVWQGLTRRSFADGRPPKRPELALL